MGRHAEEPRLSRALIGRRAVIVLVALEFSQFSSDRVSLHLFMAQVRGQGMEQGRRHAEDEENDGGWCAVLVAAVVFVLVCVVTAVSPGCNLQ